VGEEGLFLSWGFQMVWEGKKKLLKSLCLLCFAMCLVLCVVLCCAVLCSVRKKERERERVESSIYYYYFIKLIKIITMEDFFAATLPFLYF